MPRLLKHADRERRAAFETANRERITADYPVYCDSDVQDGS